jgi:hypothetical protein
MMSGFLFWDKREIPTKQKSSQPKVEWWIFEAKNTYISKVTWFLEDWVKQMKKDLL